MSDSLGLELLRAIHADISRLSEGMDEHGHRLSRIEMAVAGLRRDQAVDAEAQAALHAQFDRLRERLDRVERRLDLPDE